MVSNCTHGFIQGICAGLPHARWRLISWYFLANLDFDWRLVRRKPWPTWPALVCDSFEIIHSRIMLTAPSRYTWPVVSLASRVLCPSWWGSMLHPKSIVRHVNSLIVLRQARQELTFILIRLGSRRLSSVFILEHSQRLLTITQTFPLLELELSLLLIVVRV
jgi:hypothetical protein